MSQHTHNVTEASFDAEVTKQAGLVLVAFWAPWCSPCKTMSPLLDELAIDYVGELRIAKVNADENKALCEQLGIRGLPTLILYRDSVEQERVQGVTGKSRLAAVFDKYLES